jgi:hypothetical protein
MLSRLLRGQDARKPIDAIDPALSGLHEARLQAWSMFIGAAGGDRDRAIGRRAHRGMLPDVDVSRAIILPRRQGILRRLAGAAARALGIGTRQRSVDGTTPDGETLGDDRPTHYIGDDLSARSYRAHEPHTLSRAA